jgi:hypothetical protein
MPIATPSRKWSYAYHESHILTWRFTKRQVGMPYECWLLQAAGNCCSIIDFPIGGFSPPEGRLARGFKPPAFSRFLFQSAVKSAESF